MKNTLIGIIVALSLAACDSQQMKSNNQKKDQVAAATEPNASAIDSASAESKAHFNQGFSYIGSAKATSKADEKENLFLNAEKEFTNALVKKPDYVDALLGRGVVYIALGKPNKAEEDLKKALSLDAKNAAANYNMACLYSLTKRVDLAIDAIDLALQNGFSDYSRLKDDPDLVNLRANKEFKKILEKHKVFLN